MKKIKRWWIREDKSKGRMDMEEMMSMVIEEMWNGRWKKMDDSKNGVKRGIDVEKGKKKRIENVGKEEDEIILRMKILEKGDEIVGNDSIESIWMVELISKEFNKDEVWEKKMIESEVDGEEEEEEIEKVLLVDKMGGNVIEKFVGKLVVIGKNMKVMLNDLKKWIELENIYGIKFMKNKEDKIEGKWGDKKR